MNKIIKLTLVIIIILFLSLYFSRYNNEYYENKYNLTEDAIKKYEQDLKEGKDIISTNYLKEEKNYNNKAATIGVETSKLIEKIFKDGINTIVKLFEKE